ncbi:MAG: hypothetical protein F4Y18_01950 [Cenarchaeum sp. SB0663_bin_5]|nr:hypothetical protein [Cenarchaeum sp. SB0663_bin_5]MYL10985.1 hypothetical protein [Cenarchaeum sp. SB0669_bin_11]
MAQQTKRNTRRKTQDRRNTQDKRKRPDMTTLYVTPEIARRISDLTLIEQSRRIVEGGKVERLTQSQFLTDVLDKAYPADPQTTN